MRSRCITIAVACILTAACGGSQQPAPAAGDAASPAATPSNETAMASAAAPAPSADLAALIAAADVNKGKVLFLQCRACHSLVQETEPGKIGPTLHGIIGRPAGSVTGFAYSDAVAKSGITWSAEQIDRWLERPSDFLPGNKMVFVGIQNPQDRAAIIAYIQQESAKPATP